MTIQTPFPRQDEPLIGPSGRLAENWYNFFARIKTVTGGATQDNDLATVAKTGAASDLTGLAAVALSGDAADLSGLADIATSGSADDLIAGTVPDARLADTAVTPGTYTNVTVTVDAKGRVTAISSGSGREVLTATRTYYVATTGSDSNDGLTALTPFLTIQAAVDTVCALDISTFNVTIDVENGTYTGAVTLKSIVGSGTVTIMGDTTTPANVVVSTTSNHCFVTAENAKQWAIQGIKMQTTTSGHCLYVLNGGSLTIGNVEFGTCATHHMLCNGSDSKIRRSAGYKVSGGCNRHWKSEVGGSIDMNSVTVTVTANITVTVWADANVGSIQSIYGMTFTLGAFTVTGTRYSATGNAVLFVNGAGAAYIPGTVAGSTATGGQYV